MKQIKIRCEIFTDMGPGNYILYWLDNLNCLTRKLNFLAASSEESSIPYRYKLFCANPATEQRGMRAPEFNGSFVYQKNTRLFS